MSGPRDLTPERRATLQALAHAPGPQLAMPVPPLTGGILAALVTLGWASREMSQDRLGRAWRYAITDAGREALRPPQKPKATAFAALPSLPSIGGKL